MVIKNARVVGREGLISGCSVLIRDGIIAAVGCELEQPDGCPVWDAAGRYLSPGFIDLHTHGRNMSDAMDGTRDSLVVIARDLAQHGVTGFLITTQSAPLDVTLAAIENAVRYIEQPDPDGALPLGIYLEGPFFSDTKKGAQLPIAEGRVDLDALRAMLETGAGYIRVVALAPELSGALEAIDMIVGHGAVAAAGHTDSGYDEMMAAVEAGLSLSTHTFNGMRGLDHRQPSVVGACLTQDRVVCEAIVDGIHLHPAVVQLLYRTKGARRLALISDTVAAAGIADGEYDYGGRIFTVSQGAVRLPDGRLAGSTLSLDAALRNVTVFTGCPLHEAVEMVSTTPARVIGDVRRGGVEPGMAADLVVFDDEFTINGVWIGGRQICTEDD